MCSSAAANPMLPIPNAATDRMPSNPCHHARNRCAVSGNEQKTHNYRVFSRSSTS